MGTGLLPNYPNDPFVNLTKYWPEGMAELTAQGRYRMYLIGQFIRREYQQYLGPDYSPREVYARSSGKSRCLESVSLILAGAYPPNNDQWKWNEGIEAELGTSWQPIPIYTYPFEKMDEDRLLRTDAFCPKADQLMKNFENQDLVQNTLNSEKEFLEDLGNKVGIKISTLFKAKSVYGSLNVEYNRGYKWSDFDRWSPEYEQEMLEKLRRLSLLWWTTKFTSSTVHRTKSGPFIQEFTQNIKNYLKSKKDSKKLYLYSTHDTNLAILMFALKVFNNKIIPLGSTIFIEFHQNAGNGDHFVRLYYFNETLEEKDPNILRLPKCDYLNDCPINKFFELTKELIPEDWDKECGISDHGHANKACSLIIFLFLSLLLFNGLG